MKKKKLLVCLSICILMLVILLGCTARFVFLSPICYADNPSLSDNENYFIKKLVLEAVEDRLSVLPQGNSNIYDSSASEIDVIQLDKTQKNRKHLFILIDGNFMRTVQKTEDGYRLIVRTYGMEEASSDCYYEIHISRDYMITFFGLDP